MNGQQESIQKAFREEQDARFQNQGEVSILRKRMEKVCIEINCNRFPPVTETFSTYVPVVQLTEEHGTSVKRLKAAKEAAEVAQAQIQKDTREEIERIKTQFTFKVRWTLITILAAPLFTLPLDLFSNTK